MSAKRPADSEDELKPSSSCLTEAELQSVRDAVVNTDRWTFLIRPGAIVTAVGFIIWCTLAVSGFMRETRAFQIETTESLEVNRKAIASVSATLATVVTKQTNVIGDRWRFSDQQPWAYQLEKANRDVLREGGGKGLVVPEPITKHPEQ